MSDQRPIQRDWLGHGLQIAVMMGGVGVPLLIWGMSINTSVATMANTIGHHEKDITDLRQIQTLSTGQTIDINKALVRIETQLDGLREQNKTRR